MVDKSSKIFVAGHNGMVGKAICKILKQNKFENILVSKRCELDLRNKQDVFNFFSTHKPDCVIMAAAKVGGIDFNEREKYKFLVENLEIELNTIEAALKNDVKNFIFLGSSCIYPKNCDQPMKEEYLLSSKLEKTNEGYALAKICGLKMCEYLRESLKFNYVSVMPCNLYGENDNFHLKNSHVIPGLLRKFHQAKVGGKKSVEVWGTGEPLREFLHVDDLANAILMLLENSADYSVLNAGSSNEISIKDLAVLIKEITSYDGEIAFNTNYSNGTMRKVMDSSRLNKMGWSARIDLRDGLQAVYQWALDNNKFDEIDIAA